MFAFLSSGYFNRKNTLLTHQSVTNVGLILGQCRSWIWSGIKLTTFFLFIPLPYSFWEKKGRSFSSFHLIGNPRKKANGKGNGESSQKCRVKWRMIPIDQFRRSLISMLALNEIVYICDSLLLMAFESRDLSIIILSKKICNFVDLLSL